MNLSKKLLLVISIVFGLVIGITSFLSYTLTKSALQVYIHNQQKETIRQTMDKIDRLLYERYNDIQTVAGVQSIETIFTAKNTPLNSNSLPQKKLAELSILTGPWEVLHIVNLNRQIIATTKDSHLGHVLSESDIEFFPFEEAHLGNTYYSDVVLDPENKTPTMMFSTPIRNTALPDKPIVGAIVAHLAWPVITEVLESAGGLDGSIIDLYNNKGIEIANSNHDTDEIFVTNDSSRESIQAALLGKEVSVVGVRGDNSKDVLDTAVPERGFLTYKGNGWVLRIETDAKTAYAPAVNNALTSIVVTVPILILGSILVFIIVYQLIKPISKLTETAKHIAAGDFKERIESTSHDEVGQLAEAFNNMSQKLSQLYTNLEEKVRERTDQLEIAKQTLENKLTEVEKLNTVMVNRELKMIEMKKEIEELKRK